MTRRHLVGTGADRVRFAATKCGERDTKSGQDLDFFVFQPIRPLCRYNTKGWFRVAFEYESTPLGGLGKYTVCFAPIECEARGSKSGQDLDFFVFSQYAPLLSDHSECWFRFAFEYETTPLGGIGANTI
jgi:hypothetical protein